MEALISNAKLCCEKLKDMPDDLIERMLTDETAINNRSELADAVTELCTPQGLHSTSEEDPFLSQKS